MKRYALIVIALLSLSGCVHPGTSPLNSSEGVLVALYLQPLPQDARGLRFSFSAVSAVGENGEKVPLRLLAREVESGEHRQRLLAEGMLPRGSYSGFSFRVEKASIAGEEGESSLHVLPEEGTTPFHFDVQPGKPLFVPLSLRYRDSVRENFSFVPVLSSAPVRPHVPATTGYVTNTETDSITVFDKESLEVTGIMGTGRRPAGVVFDQVRRRAYVALSGEDAVDVIDIVSEQRVGRVVLSPGDAPRDLALSPDRRQLVVVNEGSSTVSIVDLALLAEKGRVPVGEGPLSAVIDPSGRSAFVICATAGTVSVVDIARKSLITAISVDADPVRGAFAKDGASLTIAHATSSYATVLDTRTLTVTARRYIGDGLRTIRTDETSGLIYISRRNGGRFDIVDPVSMMTLDSVATGEDPTYIAVDGELNRIFLLKGEKGELLVLEGVSKKSEALLDVGPDSCALAVMGER